MRSAASSISSCARTTRGERPPATPTSPSIPAAAVGAPSRSGTKEHLYHAALRICEQCGGLRPALVLDQGAADDHSTGAPFRPVHPAAQPPLGQPSAVFQSCPWFWFLDVPAHE